MKRTPPLGVKGIFQLKTPWVASASKVYTCIAIRDFKDIYERGHDVFTMFYQPKGLDVNYFNQDKRLNPSIITLLSDTNEIIYVPDTHILSFPSLNPVNYQRVVVSIDFGMLPDYVDMKHAMFELSQVGSKTIGKEPETKLHVAPTSGVISPSDHEILEASRLSNIDLSESALLKHLEDQALIAALRTQIKVYEKVLTDLKVI